MGKGIEKQVAPNVTFNGDWYTVTAPGGNTWTLEEEDKDVAYIEDALHAWSRWLDYVRSEQNG